MSRTERLVCPDEFQQRIAVAGGQNRYGGPNFKLVWGQTETFRAGGEWEGNGQSTYRGYRDLLVGFGDPCWILVQWQAPEKYGTPELYYMSNYDWPTGLQTLGEFPYKGRYEIVLSLKWTHMLNNRLVIEHMPLTGLLIDHLIPIIRESEKLTFARKRQLMLEHRERRERAQVNDIEASLQSAFPAYGTASRSAAHLQCNSVVQKRAEAIEHYWKRAVATIKTRGRGLSVGQL